MRHDAWASVLPWWSCQSPVVHSCDLLNHLNSFHGGMFKLNAQFVADSLLYSLSHFECDCHTVHMLTQQHLLPSLTSTVKLSLFTHVHSSPLSLAARLQWCHTNHSHYINNGWTFSGQTSSIVKKLSVFWTYRESLAIKTKITFEREEISDHQWDSGKYNWAADGDWENCVRSQGAYFEGDWGVIVLYTMFLISDIFFNKCLYFS